MKKQAFWSYHLAVGGSRQAHDAGAVVLEDVVGGDAMVRVPCGQHADESQGCDCGLFRWPRCSMLNDASEFSIRWPCWRATAGPDQQQKGRIGYCLTGEHDGLHVRLLCYVDENVVADDITPAVALNLDAEARARVRVLQQRHGSHQPGRVSASAAWA